MTGQTTTSVSFSWTQPSAGEYDGYEVTINGETTSINQDVSVYTASNLRASAQYQFEIVATADNQQSAKVAITATTGIMASLFYGLKKNVLLLKCWHIIFSPMWIVFFTEPNPVRNLQTNNKMTTSVAIHWTAPDHANNDVFNGYEYKLIDTEGDNLVQSDDDASPTLTSENFNGLTPGNTYKFEIRPFKFDAGSNKLYGVWETLEFTMGKFCLFYLFFLFY